MGSEAGKREGGGRGDVKDQAGEVKYRTRQKRGSIEPRRRKDASSHVREGKVQDKIC